LPDYLPVAEDIEGELAQIVVSGDIEAVSERLGIAKAKLERLLRSDPAAVDLIKAARAEYQAFLHMKAELLSDEALDTLLRAMRAEIEGKRANAAVRAAESILDRTTMPKITRQQQEERQDQPRRAIPDVAELIEDAKTDEEAHRIAEQYRELFRMRDALVRGAKEVIDGEIVDEANRATKSSG